MKKYEYDNSKEKGYDKSSKTTRDNQLNQQNEEFDILKWLDENIRDDVPLDEKLQKEQEEEDLLSLINASLAEQVCTEMDHLSRRLKKGGKFPTWLKVTGSVLGALVMICFLLIVTPGGRNLILSAATNFAYNQLNYEEGTQVVHQTVEDDTDLIGNQNVEEANVEWKVPVQEDGARQEEGIINILLLGEEAIDSGSGRGRTDLMIIATMNTKDKSLKLTSLMRDTLVQIPGYQDNKLNAAYEIGGVPLLYETIALNFDVKLNGYAKVGFDDFEDIINRIGGIHIKLTEAEADYLNTTNYISNPEYRNVKAGLQWMNGNQALGYCRVRYVPTGDHESNDYGRTSRQRIALNAIFEQVKSQSLPELSLLLIDLLPMVTTDITRDEFAGYLKEAVNIGFPEIQELRIPADNTFQEGYVRKMSVLIPDLDANVSMLHEFIFGNSETLME
ncbi:MAG: cell envelope-related transcriptional attenuator [Anaerocolumna sp.]|jgi:LCP family protein required for cell wall assembly|nr:cell envelope-related transcriptional attenuator [Anaerocolumna sp.]